jgi:hypothetical protein
MDPAARLTRKDQATGRRAVATLEFVMAIPLLATLMVMLVWLGFSVVGQAAVTVSARSKAWDKRFTKSPGTVLLFLKDDFISESATQRVDVSPIVAHLPPPKSKHDVMVSTWDALSIPMDSAPHWKLYATVALNAKTAGLQNAYTDGKNLVDDLSGVAQGIVSSMLNDMTSLDNLGDSATSETNAEEQRQREQLLQDKQRLEAQIQTLNRTILDTHAELGKTQAKLLIEKDEEKRKSLEREIALLEIKLDRMRSDLHDAREELEAVNEAL